MFGGMMLVFSPIATLADVLPFLGSLLRLGAGVLSAVVAGTLSLVIIALAWIAYRPLLGIALIAAASGIVVGAQWLKKRHAAQSAPPQRAASASTGG